MIEQWQQQEETAKTGSAWIGFLVQQYPLQLATEEYAFHFAVQLIQHHVLVPVPYHCNKVLSLDTEHTYQVMRYAQDETDLCLNFRATNSECQFDVSPSAEQTHLLVYKFDSMLQLILDKYVEHKLHFVDYKNMFADAVFLALLDHVCLFRYISVELLSNEERMCLFLNMLNFMVLHQRYKYNGDSSAVLPIREECYFVGRYMLSMDDIFFNILCKQVEPWKDYLQSYQVSNVDLRVYFCASTGEDYRILPRRFSREFLNEDMQAAAEHFVEIDTQLGDVSQACKVTIASMYDTMGMCKANIIQFLLANLPTGKIKSKLDSWNKTNQAGIELMYRAKERVDSIAGRRKSIKYV